MTTLITMHDHDTIDRRRRRKPTEKIKKINNYFIRYCEKYLLDCGGQQPNLFLGAGKFFQGGLVFRRSETMAELSTSSQLAKLWRCSQQTVRDLTAKGVIKSTKSGNVNKYNLVTATGDYIEHLRGIAASWSKEESQRDLENEKLAEDVKLKRARARRATLEADELEGKLHRASDVEALFADNVLAFRSAVLALPSKLAAAAAASKTKAEAASVIEKEIHLMLYDLSDYKYNAAEFARLVNERTGISDRNIDDE